MTTPTLPTFSGLPRWMRCEILDVLPRVRESSEYARAGTARHAFLERIANMLTASPPVLSLEEARESALASAPLEHRALLAAIPVEALAPDRVAPEVALAYNIDTGEARELGRGLDRDYGEVAPNEIVGTVDRLALVGSDGVYVGDYKGRAHGRRAAEDEQIIAGALAAARLYGKRFADVEVLRLIGDRVVADKARLELIDLDRFELALTIRRDRMSENQARFAKDPADIPEAEVGEHCAYCPSARYCPAQMAVARAVLGGDSEEVRGIIAVGPNYLDEVSAPRVHALVQQAEKRLAEIKEALKNFARVTPFQLANGKWYGVPPDATERKLAEDGRLIQQAVSEVLDEEAAKACVTVEATFGGIEDAVRAFVKAHPDLDRRGALKEWNEKVEDLLRQRALLSTVVGGQVKVHVRK